MAFTTTKQGGLTIHYFAVPFVAPSWAIKDGNLYLGLYPQVVSGAAEHVTTKGKSILDNPQFVALRKRLGGQNVSAVSYTDLPRTAAEGYQEVLMLSRLYLGMADLLGAKTPAMAFPTLSKLMPHVTPVAAVAWSDATGWHAKEVSPFPGSEILQSAGMGTIMAAEQAMMVGVALPALNRPRMTSNRVKSASNLRQIGQGMLLYANENRGKYPKTMGEIFLTEDLTIEVFVNPETKNQPPRDKNKDEQALWVNTSSDYEYLGAGKTSSATADVILAHEKIRPNAQGLNILYGDGHVEFVQLPQAQQMIATQKAKDGKQARNGNDTRSASNLRQIGQGLLLHSNQANGKYPTTLGELILTQDFAVGSFVNPDLKGRPLPRDKDKEEQAAWVNKEGDYEYLGTGKTNKSGPEVILAHEKLRPDDKGVNVLFGDGHVEWVETGDARQRIAAQQKQDEALKGLK
jgi:prepilin-type processing-associated H-X9-DG protein